MKLGRWRKADAPESGTERKRFLFAFIPKRCTDGSIRWWEWVMVEEVFALSQWIHYQNVALDKDNLPEEFNGLPLELQRLILGLGRGENPSARKEIH